MNRRNLLLGTGSLLLSSTLPVWSAKTRTIGGPAFGSWWRAALPDAADTQEIGHIIETVIASVDNAMSPFIGSSEISRFNAATDMNWHQISKDTEKVITESLRIAQLTEGAFDPTIGPLVGRYGFGPISGSSMTGYRSIDLIAGQVRKTEAESTLDLCGIAKGYALDLISEKLAACRLEGYFLEAGGEVLTRGSHPEGRSWQVGIETPKIGAPTLQRIVNLKGMALATSGNVINGGQVDEVTFSHIIDPKNEEPIGGRVASVSVISKTAMEADALATAFMVMGRERSLALADAEGIAVLFLTRSGEGFAEDMSAQFAQYIMV